MTNLQNLIDQAKKELRENLHTLCGNELGLESFLEAKLRQAYRAGAEGMLHAANHCYCSGPCHVMGPQFLVSLEYPKSS